ncbi:hypothetical protein L0128_04730 [candidate division KSB1 bacterium]|nr:hypothetical protein [candidate division KSB1 bacterium]
MHTLRLNNFVLRTNYHRLFNTITILHYHLPETAQVRLQIYNLVGAEIRQLVNENQTAGE